jgi:HEAT repeat protein
MIKRRFASRSVLVLLLALLPVGCGHKQRPPVPSEAGKALIAEFPAKQRKLAAEAFDIRSADRRCHGVVNLYEQDWGKQEPCLKVYALLAKDEMAVVRAAAVTALGESRNDAYVGVLLEALEHDPVQYVRVSAAEGLRKVHGGEALEPLTRHAKADASLDVRIRCIRALRYYPQRPALDALLVCLGDEEFGIRFSARQSLAVMTGQDALYDVNQWTKTLGDRSDPFVHPAAARRSWWRVWGT